MPFSISGLLTSRETDIGRTALAQRWKKACINLFITYFNIELKRTKLTSHTYQTYGYVLVTTVVESAFTCCHGFFIFSTRESVSASETAKNLSSRDDDIFQTTMSWQLGGSDVMWRTSGLISRYQSFSPISPMSWYRCDTSGVYVWETLTLLFINMW
jgi:hypothetical protein